MDNFTAIVSDGLNGGAANSTNRLTLQLHNNGFRVERWHHSPPCKSHPNFYRSLDPRKKDLHLKESLRIYPGVSLTESGGRDKFKAYTIQLKTLNQLYSILGIFITVA